MIRNETSGCAYLGCLARHGHVDCTDLTSKASSGAYGAVFEDDLLSQTASAMVVLGPGHKGSRQVDLRAQLRERVGVTSAGISPDRMGQPVVVCQLYGDAPRPIADSCSARAHASECSGGSKPRGKAARARARWKWNPHSRVGHGVQIYERYLL